jgi:hypothetical protein
MIRKIGFWRNLNRYGKASGIGLGVIFYYFYLSPEKELMTFNGKVCPYCRHRDVSRIRRIFWMRFIPFSRLYECNGCLRTYIALFS